MAFGTRTHKRLGREYSRVMELKNGQRLLTLPRELARRYDIKKATLLKWSPAGEGRILLEVVKE